MKGRGITLADVKPWLSSPSDDASTKTFGLAFVLVVVVVSVAEAEVPDAAGCDRNEAALVPRVAMRYNLSVLGEHEHYG